MDDPRPLRDELVATVGDDPDLVAACGRVGEWAEFADPHRWEPLRPTRLCRRGLIEGRALELDYLAADAERMERAAAALRTLIAHVEATNPRARRRQRRGFTKPAS